MSCSVCIGYNAHACPVCGPQSNIQTCPNCKGTGEADWKVFDIISREVVPCTELAYIYAAEDEDEAEIRRQRYCKLSCECETCRGVGEVYEYNDNYYTIY